MQLKMFCGLIVLVWCGLVAAQTEQPTNKDFENKLPKSYRIGEVNADLLNSYYQQDGDHSAIEGGSGSQELNDFVTSVVVSIPVDASNLINATVSWDTYSSASSRMLYYDNIAGYDTQSGASIGKIDTRQSGSLAYSRITPKSGIFTIGGGWSNEYDVQSVNAKTSWEIESADKSKLFNVSLNGIFDTWEMLYATNVVGHSQTSYYSYGSKDNRNTYSLALHYSFIVNKKLQASINFESILQDGILATPFQTVWFDRPATFDPSLPIDLIAYSDLLKADFGFDGDPSDNVDFQKIVGIERLPRQRLRNALMFRSSWFASKAFVLKGSYRYYMDSHDVAAHTVNVELPYKPTQFFSVYPFYRFHTQTASKYFKPFGEHQLYESEYFTSDWDLGNFDSNQIGVGFRYSPPDGILHYKNLPLKNRTSAFKSINLRAAKYFRTDGLDAFIISSNLSFTF